MVADPLLRARRAAAARRRHQGHPVAESIARDLAGVHRYVKKHTRLQAWLTRTLQDLHREGHMRMPPCLLPLRRNTRFCSEHSLLSAHLQCRDGLELAARMPEFRQMVGYDTLSLKKKERFNKVEGLLTKVSARARAERAAHILHPLAELVRVCGAHDTPVLPPAWARLSGEFLARYHKLDFADRTPGGAAAKAERQEAMRDMVKRREEPRARAGAPRVLGGPPPGGTASGAPGGRVRRRGWTCVWNFPPSLPPGEARPGGGGGAVRRGGFNVNVMHI